MIQRRQTGKYIGELKEILKGIIKSFLKDFVNYELHDVMHNKEIHCSPSSLNTDLARILHSRISRISS